jgi:hypothetical protein
VIGADHAYRKTIHIDALQGVKSDVLSGSWPCKNIPPTEVGAMRQLKRSLEFGEVGTAILDRDHLAVENGSLDRDIETFRNEMETVGPVVTIAGEDFDLALNEMDLNPIAIEFDFVNPLVSHRWDEARYLRRLGAPRSSAQ